MLEQSIADEVEAAIRAGSAQKHLETFKRVTDLFLTSPTVAVKNKSNCSARCSNA